jgi:hypothetical protein
MSRPYVVVVSSEKGGVGKTTLATNLAIYLKALNEDLPVTLCSFDNHLSVDRMFRINGSGNGQGDVTSLFNGAHPNQLIETGEFGVQFIPSNNDPLAVRNRIDGPAVLARKLAATELPGILIIDTRPDLDLFTQNALYCADRVIVPVKDAPSLENCKHLYDFFSTHNLGKSALRILPCLIDSRIHYDGPFRDPYQLLKGYAINRGYKCLEGFIAKSPKVESLNTNPEGKIYPIITHGRNTEVHIQMSQIARQVYLTFIDNDTNRLDRYAESLQKDRASRDQNFAARLRKIDRNCLLCGKPLISDNGLEPAGYYAETSDGRHSAFIEEECLTNLVFRYFYGAEATGASNESLTDLFRESAQHTYFVLRRAPHTRNFYQQQISFYRFDEDGLEISCKSIDLKEVDKGILNRERSQLYTLAQNTLFGTDQLLGDDCLIIRKVCSDFPDEILYEEKYNQFRDIASRIQTQFIEKN